MFFLAVRPKEQGLRVLVESRLRRCGCPHRMTQRVKDMGGAAGTSIHSSCKREDDIRLVVEAFDLSAQVQTVGSESTESLIYIKAILEREKDLTCISEPKDKNDQNLVRSPETYWTAEKGDSRPVADDKTWRFTGHTSSKNTPLLPEYQACEMSKSPKITTHSFRSDPCWHHCRPWHP